jgi:arginyl-tRNA synthetase
MDFIYTHIASLLEPLLGQQVIDVLEAPKDANHGDVAFPCFHLAKQRGQSPVEIAKDISSQVQKSDIIESVQAIWPYVNFFINSSFLAGRVLPEVLLYKSLYWQGEKVATKVLIESPSPNTNKPLHLWHIRNMLLGNSLDAILRFAWYESIKVEVVNDRGIHICKSMLAYDLYGNDLEPDKKSDHFVGDWYVLFDKKSHEDSSLIDQAQEMLRKWEQWDDRIRSLWNKMNKRAIDGFAVTYDRYGTRIDKHYYESSIYEQGKDLVKKWLDNSVFVRDEKWNVAFPVYMKDGDVSYFVVLRSDGTAVYATQDIALADQRWQDYRMDTMVYIVGSEQEQYFKTLFQVFHAMGYNFAWQCHHMSYGMISLPDGKMKSRKGNVVDADNLADDMSSKARDILFERYPHLDQREIDRRSEIISMAAIKFFMLKYDVHKDFVFNREESLSFEGETGPYMLYSYARCAQIVSKAWGVWDDIDFRVLTHSSEKKLILSLLQRSDVVQQAAQEYRPTSVARYILDITHLFNSYYQQVHILTDDEVLQKARVALVASVQYVLATALKLLGIGVLDEM